MGMSYRSVEIVCRKPAKSSRRQHPVNLAEDCGAVGVCDRVDSVETKDNQKETTVATFREFSGIAHK